MQDSFTESLTLRLVGEVHSLFFLASQIQKEHSMDDLLNFLMLLLIIVLFFIVQDHGWTLSNASVDCSLFFKDYIHLVEQRNIKLTKLIVWTLTARNNQINSHPVIATHIVIFLSNQFQLPFLFPLRTMIFLHWPMLVDLSLNLETAVTMSLREVSLLHVNM